MVFLCKQPSELPRVLCASYCPPHDVSHEIDDYPLYYDPLYFPSCYANIFDSEVGVCQWLLTGLQDHFDGCVLCSHLQFLFERRDANDSIWFYSRIFYVKFHGVEMQVPLLYIESSLFSFCRLLRRLHAFMTKLHSICFTFGESAMHAEAIIEEIPLWLFRDYESYVSSFKEVVCTICR